MADRSREAGFMLMEALVALVVAGLFLAAFARAFAVARGQARAPMEVLSAVAVASVAEVGATSADDVRIGAYRYDKRVRAVAFQERPAHLAPAPREDPAADQAASATQKAPDRQGAPQAPAAPRIRIIAVSVETPSGRRFDFETIRRQSISETRF